MKNQVKKALSSIIYADDDTSSIRALIGLRLPSLVVGLFLGLGLSLVTSNFEQVLARDIRVVFFIPFIVYLAAAIGTQTQSVYARDLINGHAHFFTYLVKETLVGLLIGILLALVSGVVILGWFRSWPLTLTVSISIVAALSVAPPIGVVVTHLLQWSRKDPAVGAGPLATVIQDMMSIVIYGSVASVFMI